MENNICDGKVHFWEGYKPPPAVITSEWIAETIRGAFNPPTLDEISNENKVS
jgi:hypothetical protein